MRSRLLQDGNGLRTFAVMLDTGDEAIALEAFARDNGAFRAARLAYFDWSRRRINQSRWTIRWKSHRWWAILRSVRTASQAFTLDVRPTLEVIVTESPAHLRQVKNAETGLALIKL